MPPLPVNNLLSPWMQWAIVIAFVLTQIFQVVRDWATKRSEQSNTREKTFIDTMMELTKEYPELMKAHKELMSEKSALESRILILEEKSRNQEGEIKELRSDRDSWKGQAARVPELEGQLKVWKEIVCSSNTDLEIHRLKIASLEAKIASMNILVGRSAELLIPENSHVSVSLESK